MKLEFKCEYKPEDMQDCGHFEPRKKILDFCRHNDFGTCLNRACVREWLRAREQIGYLETVDEVIDDLANMVCSKD
jgi:hypothetical protein